MKKLMITILIIVLCFPLISVAQIYGVNAMAFDQSKGAPNIDSLIRQKRQERILKRQKALLSGEIPIGWFTVDMSKLKRYNQFEGVYIGAGGHTNEQLLKGASLGGFIGYGFKDKKTKRGFDIGAWSDSTQHFKMNGSYSYDTQESNGSQFFDERSEIFEPSSFRTFYVDKMNYEERMRFSVAYTQTKVTFYGAIQRRIIDRGYDISNGVKVLFPDRYNASGLVAGIRFAPDVDSSFQPVIRLQLTRGVSGLLHGAFNYNRLETKLQLSKTIGHLGRSSLQVIGNLLDGSAPYFEYFNGRGTYGNFGLYASGSFVTMHPDEFMNDRSIGLFFTHTFGTLFPPTLLFNPSPALVFNYGWGELKSDPPMYYLPVRDMHRGFVEAGVQINNLLDLKVYGLGLGAYYRMGAYRNPTVKENLAFKIVISFPVKD